MKRLRSLFNPNELLLLLLAYLFMLWVLPSFHHLKDGHCWNLWSSYNAQHGLGWAYDNPTNNYMPLYQYVLWAYGKITGGTMEASEAHTHWLKAFTLLFDMAGVWMVSRFASPAKRTGWMLGLLFWLPLIYNTFCWGQIDAVVAFFVTAAALLAWKRMPGHALFMLMLAMNVKLQALIFVPVLVLICLANPPDKKGWRIAGIWLLITVAAKLVILFPFIRAGQLGHIWQVATHSVDFFPVISMNAFNFWYLALSGDLRHTSDQLLFLGISYKYWGILLFGTSAFFALWPLLRIWIRGITGKAQTGASLVQICSAGALIWVLFFFFNTQMHERYSHPALLLAAVPAVAGSGRWAFGILSLAYFLNMEKVLQFMALPNYGTFIFDTRFIAALYLAALILLYLNLYRKHGTQPV